MMPTRAFQSRSARIGSGAEHRYLARIPAAIPLEDLDDRRLPSSVRAEKREDLPAFDLEVHVTDGLE